MTSFKEEYDKSQSEEEQDFEITGRRTGVDAITSLNEADQKEVYRFDVYSHGLFNYVSEDNKRMISIGFPTQDGIVLPCYATIPDLLITRGRDYLEIRLFDIN